MKTAFLISGFNYKQTAADQKYADLRKAIASKGYTVVPSPFVWNHTTVSQYVDKFVDFYSKKKGDYNVIIGNSYGAIVAFLSAPLVEPDRIILCSLSAYFAEDADKTTAEYRIKRFGKRRNEAMKSLSAKKTAAEIVKKGIEVTLLYGEKEEDVYPHLVERVKATGHDLSVDVIRIPNAPHQFRKPAYIAGIKDQL